MESFNVSRKTLMIKGNAPIFIVIMCLIILWGCATKETIRNIPDEEVLQGRVTEYWDHVIKEDYIKSYEYEDPIFRKTVSINQYIKSHNEAIKVKEVRTITVKIEDNSGDVDLMTKIELRVPGGKPLVVDSEKKDRWGKIDGIWYHVKDRNPGKGAKGN